LKLFHFLDQRLEVHDVLHEPVELDLVVVDDRDEAGDAVLARGHGRLPHLPRLHLAVAEETEDAVRIAVEPAGERHAERDREALPERARRGLDPGQRDAIRVPLEAAPELAERLQLGLGQLARLRQRGVQRRDAVALRHDEAITAGPRRVAGAPPERVEDEGGDDLGRGQRAAGMPRAGGGDHADHVLAQLPRDRLQALDHALLGHPRHRAVS
jgi:hypothetical protein